MEIDPGYIFCPFVPFLLTPIVLPEEFRIDQTEIEEVNWIKEGF